ncbi:hypothetical protein AHAS_Ahas17G0025400 [Arachis hypogaea]
MAFPVSYSVSELGGGNWFLRLLLGVDVSLALVEGIVASLRCFRDLYNLEKSKQVNAFRCGEYDECIEKATASAANSNKKAVKYAHREDAIIHALELESARVGKELLVVCSRTGIEARGFIFGPPIALAIGAKLVPLRKLKKLPGKVISQEYILEYGRDCLEMHVGAVEAVSRASSVQFLLDTYALHLRYVLCRCNVKMILFLFPPGLNGSSNKVIDVRTSLTLCIKFLFEEDFVVKARSLQALGFILIARPEYMLEKDIGKILEGTLSSNADTCLKIQVLQNMLEYLLDAESKMGTDGLQMSFIFMQSISTASENGNQKIPSKIPVSGKGKPKLSH